jgi:hypothetical protein
MAPLSYLREISRSASVRVAAACASLSRLGRGSFLVQSFFGEPNIQEAKLFSMLYREILSGLLLFRPMEVDRPASTHTECHRRGLLAPSFSAR